jgi:hypothetical protein
VIENANKQLTDVHAKGRGLRVCLRYFFHFPSIPLATGFLHSLRALSRIPLFECKCRGLFWGLRSPSSPCGYAPYNLLPFHTANLLKPSLPLFSYPVGQCGDTTRGKCLVLMIFLVPPDPFLPFSRSAFRPYMRL